MFTKKTEAYTRTHCGKVKLSTIQKNMSISDKHQLSLRRIFIFGTRKRRRRKDE